MTIEPIHACAQHQHCDVTHGGTLGLTPTEIATIQSAGTLQIGRSDGTGTLSLGTYAGVLGDVTNPINAGTLSLAAGSVALNSGGIAIPGNVSLQALASGGQITQNAGGSIAASSLTASSNAGISLPGANQVASFTATNSASGAISLTDTTPTLTLSGISQAAGGAITINNTGTLVNAGTIALAGGSTFSTSNHAMTNSGTASLSGVGTIVVGAGNTLTNQGTIAAGNSPGTLNITGDLVLTPGSVTNVELAGTGAGQFDVINVSGAATLDGTLNVAHFGGFTPVAGNTFQIMNYASRTGDFATKNFPVGFGYTTFVNAANYILSADGVTNTFTGLGVVNNLWDDPNNWSLTHVPTTGEFALIPNLAPVTTVNVTGGQQAFRVASDENLQVNGGTLTLGTGASSVTAQLGVSGGALSLGGAMTANALNLSAGTISGTGSLAVTNSYTQTGGTINLTGRLRRFRSRRRRAT